MALSAAQKADLAAIIGSTTPARKIEDMEASAGLSIFAAQGAAVADLSQTIAGPSIAEVQAISDKVDALLASLRAAGLIA